MATRKSRSEVNSALQRFRFAATGRWAVSIRTYVAIVFPFGFLTSIEREQILNPGPLSESALIALGGELACALFIFVTQEIKSRKIPRWFLNNSSGKPDAMWTLVFISFVITTFVYFISSFGTITIGSIIFSPSTFDVGYAGIVLVPLLMAYFGK